MAEIKIGKVIGPQGPDGKNIEYEWSGTELGVRIEGSPAFEYVDLKGSPGVTEVTKADVGLGDVDNTSDLDKPISAATAAELSRKANFEDVDYMRRDIHRDVEYMRRDIERYVDYRLGDIDNVLDTINGEVI